MSFTGKVALFAIAALVVSQGAFAAIGYSVRSNADHHLYRIDLNTGAAVDLGQIGFNDAEGLAFAGSSLYAIGGYYGEFWNITTPPGSLVGYPGYRRGQDAGLDYNAVTGTMYNINSDSDGSWLYTIDLATGAATYVGQSSIFADGLAINSAGVAYASDFIFSDSLYRVNLISGELTLVGGLGFDANLQSGMGFDNSGRLWALTHDGVIYSMNTSTGAATQVANVTLGGVRIGGFEGLACTGGEQVIPELPAPMLASLAGLVGLAWKRRR